MNYKTRCRLHWACDVIHAPNVRVTGTIYYGRQGGLIVTSGPYEANEWLRLAAAPRPVPLWDGRGERPSLPYPRTPLLQGVCVTISH
jgi:hypothetical protein